MRIEALRVRSVGRFTETVELPIADLDDAELVAVVGENGAGKTTLLECIPAALYRSMPSRGALHAMANNSDTLVELVLTTDQRYTLRLIIDGTSKRPKGEAYVLDADGQPLNDGKLTSFDAVVAERFVASSVFLSSAFAAQTGEGNFFDLKASERKDLFARLLGLARLEELAVAAKERAQGANASLAELRGTAGQLEADAERAEDDADDVDACRGRMSHAVSAREEMEQKAAKLRAAMTDWLAECEQLGQRERDARVEEERSRSAFDRIRSEFDRVGEEIASSQGRQVILKKRLASQEQLRELVEMIPAWSTEHDALSRKVDDASERVEFSKEAIRVWERDHHALRAEVDAANAKLREHNNAINRAKDEVAAAERLAKRLDDVPCGGEGEFAACALISSAAEARASLPKLRSALTVAIEDCERFVQTVGPGVLAKRLSEHSSEKPELAEPAPSEWREALADLARRLDEAKGAQAKLDAMKHIESDLEASVQDERTLQLRQSELSASFAEAQEELDRRREDLHSAATALSDGRARKPQEISEQSLEGVRDEERAAAVALAAAEGRAERSAKAADELQRVRKELDEALAVVGDWQHLATALGRNGIQALEIDASGPEVSTLTNELLHACYGPRFSVSLETAVLKADGKGTKEVFDLRVIDTARGTEGSAALLSGGEKVMVSEALSLAIAIYNARKSDMPLRTLFRDECAGALSSKNATLYIEMLRRAIRLGGFERCYFIAHQPHLWELADRVIEVADGQCRVSGAALEVAA